MMIAKAPSKIAKRPEQFGKQATSEIFGNFRIFRAKAL
jgi:hypothetical protein